MKWILTPSRRRNELRNCYDKYSNDLHYIDTQLINIAYMKFAIICVHSIKKYSRMSKWCVTFFAGYICLGIHVFVCIKKRLFNNFLYDIDFIFVNDLYTFHFSFIFFS